jgi:hypothetical protein
MICKSRICRLLASRRWYSSEGDMLSARNAEMGPTRKVSKSARILREAESWKFDDNSPHLSEE